MPSRLDSNCAAHALGGALHVVVGNHAGRGRRGRVWALRNCILGNGTEPHFRGGHRFRRGARPELVHGSACAQAFLSGSDAEDEIITIVASKAVLILLSSVLGRYMGKWAGYF